MTEVAGRQSRKAAEIGAKQRTQAYGQPDGQQGCMMLTEKDKMLAGELYDASAPEIQAELAPVADAL